MIVANYRAVRVRVIELSNAVYRIASAETVDINECRGVRLPGGSTDFINDLLLCARDAGVDVSGDVVDALVQASVEGVAVFIMLR